MLTVTKQQKAEEGAVIFIALYAMVLLGVLSFLVVDVGAYVMAHRNAQNVADSISLGITSQLKGTQASWMNSKRAGFLSLRQNSLYGGSWDFKDEQEFGNFNVIPGGFEYGPYGAIQYDFGNVTITMERGFYGLDAAGAVYQFIPLEEPVSQCAGCAPPDVTHNLRTPWGDKNRENGEPCPVNGCYVWEVANSARVSVSVNNLPTFFQGIFSSLGANAPLSQVTRVSIASLDDFY